MSHLYSVLVAAIADRCTDHDATFLAGTCPSCDQGIPPIEAD